MNTILICALFAYGMFTLQRPGFLLYFLRNVWKKLPKGIHEPLFDCGVCVASLWGGLAYCLVVFVAPLLPGYWPQLLLLPVYIIAASGITAFMDRAVKAFEKHYGYKTPNIATGEQKWDYLLPYNTLRTLLVDSFVRESFRQGIVVIEVGGYHKEWENIKYLFYNHETTLTRGTLGQCAPYMNGLRYHVVILGLCFEGDIKVLQELISGAETAVIEYSDDGISRAQIAQITEGMEAQLYIPEFEINTEKPAPKTCGGAQKRKILYVQPQIDKPCQPALSSMAQLS
jgi:hypothetical protein